MFQRTVVFQISGDAGRAESVIADPGLDADIRRVALNHPIGVLLRHRVAGERAGLACRRSGTKALRDRRRCRRRQYIHRGTFPDCDGRGPHAPCRLSRVNGPSRAGPAQNNPVPASRAGVDAGEAIDHDRDERAIALADQRGFLHCGFTTPRVSHGCNAGEQLPGLVGRQHRGLAFLHHIFRTEHGVRRIHVDDVAHHQPIKQHAQGRQMLLDRGQLELFLQLLDESRDMGRVDRVSSPMPRASHHWASDAWH